MFLAIKEYKVQLYDLQFKRETRQNVQVIKFYRLMADSVLLCGSEVWVVKNEDAVCIQSTEINFLK